MLYGLCAHLFAALLDLIVITRLSDHEKDFELVLLRQQLRMLQRTQVRPLRISRWQKLTLAVLVAKVAQVTRRARSRLSNMVVLFKPATILKWHRELVRWKWTYKRRRPPGRPRIASELEALIVRLAKENPRWGYTKLHGELCKLGYTVSRSTVTEICSSAGRCHRRRTVRGMAPRGAPSPSGHPVITNTRSWRVTSLQWKRPG